MLFENFLKKNYTLIVGLLLIVGFSIRLFGISIIPRDLNQDEASIGYEAFSILTTGFDRNGVSYPVHLVSWGSGQNALYAYLSMPFIKMFGLNEFSVRIVNALFSCMSLLVFYLLIRLNFNKKTALLALFLLAICPWSIMSARWGLESNIFPSLFLFAVFFLYMGIVKKQVYYVVSSVLFAISLYAYGTSYLLVPLFLISVIPYLFYQKKISLKYFIFSGIAFLIISFPIIIFIAINHFNLPQVQMFGVTMPRLEANRTTVIFNIVSSDFLQNIIRNMKHLLKIIIIQADDNLYNVIPAIGTVYHISLPFFLAGIIHVVKNRKCINNGLLNNIMLIWILVSIFFGITSAVNINRINIIFFPMLYFTLVGILNVKKIIFYKYQYHYKIACITLYSVLFLLFSLIYISYNNKEFNTFFCDLKNAIEYCNANYPNQKIHITTDNINTPYIYVCFYNKINPVLFKNTVKYSGYDNAFKEVLSFGKYTFGIPEKLANDEIEIVSENDIKFLLLEGKDCKQFKSYYVISPLSRM